ncbi:MAG: YggT family protein [Chloroflexi bacterium]|nr:YggT family protein [Chloroflexota bacterium]
MQERRVERPGVVERPVDGYVETPTARTTAPAAYDEVAYERVATPPATAAVDQVNATSYDPYAERRRSSYKLVQGIWLLFGIVEGLLAIRFVLKLLGANEAAGFASFIYAASGPFIAPFNNLFGNPGSGGSVLELNTLVAIVVYMLVAWLVAKVVWLLAGENRSATRTVSNATRARVE